MELLLIIAIAVITSPIWLGAVTGIGGTVFGLAVSVVCIAGAFYIARASSNSPVPVNANPTASLPIINCPIPTPNSTPPAM